MKRFAERLPEAERGCARFGLDSGQRDQLRLLAEYVASDRRAPTTVRDLVEIDRVHLADSLVALELAGVRSAQTIVDVGSGAGFPGLPIAVARPRCAVRLVESQRRKCAFLEDLVQAAAIENAEVVCARAEEWPPGSATHDVVLARAVGPQSTVLEYAAPLLREGGVLVDWRGRRNSEEERSAAAAAVELGMELVETRHVEPYVAAREHHLHVFRKVAPTPQRFPRRAGVARKRPLGC